MAKDTPKDQPHKSKYYHSREWVKSDSGGNGVIDIFAIDILEPPVDLLTSPLLGLACLLKHRLALWDGNYLYSPVYCSSLRECDKIYLSFETSCDHRRVIPKSDVGIAFYRAQSRSKIASSIFTYQIHDHGGGNVPSVSRLHFRSYFSSDQAYSTFDMSKISFTIVSTTLSTQN